MAPASQQLSKRKQKRLAKETQLREQKRVRREERRAASAAKKQARRAERDAALADVPPEEREQIERVRVEKMRAVREKERAQRTAVRQRIAEYRSYGVCIDLGWNDKMSEKERRSLARQLSYSYSSLRKAVMDGLNPVALSIVGLDEVMRTELTNAAKGWEAWPIVVTQQSLEEVYGVGTENLVYLTHDSENVLSELDERCVYVIGGLVDRNRLKGVTAEKAREMGVRTARLNIDEYIRLEKGTRVLTVNHCVDILLQVSNGTSWNETYMKVLPVRKGVQRERGTGVGEQRCSNDEVEIVEG